MKDQKIADIKKRFKNEWLLIEITDMDRATTTIRRGRLLAHSANRDEIYRKDMTNKKFTLIDYSENKMPKGYAAAF
jgi:hypothetical protein